MQENKKPLAPGAEATINRQFNASDFSATGEAGHIEGHAAVFEQRANIGGMFYEVIERGAFDGCDFNDVPFFVNHNARQIPVARSRRNNGNSTMKISVDGKGLLVSADLDIENNQESRSLHSAIKRGDMDGMSFSFRIGKQRWENRGEAMPTRYIEKFTRVFEVSAVNEPAYADTDIHARGALENDRAALESARGAFALESARALDVEKLKFNILMEV